MSRSLVASATKGTAVPPALVMSSATACNADSVRPATITFKPSAAKRLQSRAPSPRSGPTPITIAVFIARLRRLKADDVTSGSGRDRFGAIGQSRGIADCRAAGRHVAGHDRACTDFRELADADVAQNGRAGADIDAAADARRARWQFATAADADVLEDDDLVADHHIRSDHDARGVVEIDGRSDVGCRMNA